MFMGCRLNQVCPCRERAVFCQNPRAVQFKVTQFGLAKARGWKPRLGRPIATDAGVRPPAKQVRIGTEMKAVLPATASFFVVFCRFFGVGHHRARGLPTCTRLKKMQAIACVKIGCPNPKMAVLSPFFNSFFWHLCALRGCLYPRSMTANNSFSV